MIHTLTSHGHWVNSLALSTDFALRTGYFDHKGKTPATQEERVATAKARFEKAARLNGKLTEHLVSASDDNVRSILDRSWIEICKGLMCGLGTNALGSIWSIAYETRGKAIRYGNSSASEVYLAHTIFLS